MSGWKKGAPPDEIQIARFLHALRAHGSVAAAAAGSGVQKWRWYAWRKEWDWLAREWELALDDFFVRTGREETRGGRRYKPEQEAAHA